MNIFDRYVIREHVAPFVFAFSVIMFVLILKLMLDFMDLLISKGIPLLVMGQLFVYNLAWMVALVVPMSVLVATVMAFGRMGASGEIIAMKSAGVSMYRVVTPVLFIAALLTAGMVWFNDRVLPEANYRARNLNAAVAFFKPSLSLKNREGQFVDIASVTIRADSINYATEELYGVTLFRRSGENLVDTIVAKSGQFIAAPDSNRMTLLLNEGQIHHFEASRPEQYVRSDFGKFFQNFQVNLGLDTDFKTSRNDRTKTIGMMRNDIVRIRNLNQALEMEVGRLPQNTPGYVDQVNRLRREIQTNRQDIAANLVEIHKKYSIPFASLVFVLLGASLGILVRRSGASIGIGLSIGFFTLYYLGLIGGESAGDRMLVAPWIAMWAPNIILGSLGVYMLVYATRR
ncbi:MAG: LptF/LptG family permease [Candidatus Latescibacterota bacterium]